MTKQYLIGVDLGTSATKAAIYRADGSLVAVASREVPIYTPRPGIVEQENDDFYRTAAETVKTCLQQSGIDPREVAAIAFDSQMAGIGTVDEDFKPATRFDSWLDMRCQPYIEEMNRIGGERVTQLTGCAPTCDHGPKILWWMHEHPQDFKRIAKFVTPSGYVAGKIAGLKADQAFMDYTFIHFSGFADSRACRWSDELCRMFGMDAEKLPHIVSPWDVIGEVKEAAAADFGLAAGTPVVAGCGDTAANALGAGMVRPGMLFDNAGTAAILAACTDQFVADLDNRALLNMHSVIPGLYNPLAYIAGGGLALRWFRDQFYNTHQGQSLPADEDIYAQMCTAAQAIPAGADGLFFSPHLGGRICPSDGQMRGAWLGFSWGHTQAHFFRAILEGVAFEYAYYLDILKRLIPGLALIETRATGGGAKSDVWNQIKADVLNVPYQHLPHSEFGTWGCAMLAGKATGVFGDLVETALAFSRPVGAPVAPRPDAVQVYQPLVGRYIEMEASLHDLFHRLA
ncbi:sugar (pentulose and hexulose) kinase [Longilinea arvoryzae]|uniref:Sugar (Pentulose and hexulose) kinase n=1 Tax=Longilinea arvoryzae TaxID=360412 RepID=A0A0S7BHY7_9CHLR|nr:FGGY family carbohydrate kinase [Longilinea arvoryzae]GAP13146.1 sugar (pentulose and hexulose) kinase [Longilinea arvoryzae]